MVKHRFNAIDLSMGAKGTCVDLSLHLVSVGHMAIVAFALFRYSLLQYCFAVLRFEAWHGTTGIPI